MPVTPVQPFDQTRILRDSSGICHYLDRPTSLVAALRATTQRVPTAEALHEVGGRTLTYTQLWDAAARVAGGLAQRGVHRGDRVAVSHGNSIEWCVAFFGTLLAGGVVIPLNTALTGPEREHIITDSQAVLTLTTGDPLPEGPPRHCDDLTPDDVAAIFYTSGTTGAPKGATMTHRNFLANNETVRRVAGFPHHAEGIRHFVAAPLSTVTAANSQLLPMCELGGTTVILPAFTPATFLAGIAETRPTVLVGSPAVFRMTLNHPDFPGTDTTSVRLAVYGAAPASPEFLGAMSAAFPTARVEAAFGLTEVASVATYLPYEYTDAAPGSVGYAAPVVDLDLLDVDDATGVGELMVRGPNVVPGYWRSPEATAAAFVGGWLRTGDLARITDTGLVYIVDRKKDVINRGGANVYSVEVENALVLHPDVAEVAVLGVPDAVLGERVGAVLVGVDGRPFYPVAVVVAAATRLAAYKLPEFVCVRQEPLPRNASAKVVKPGLRASTEWVPLPRAATRVQAQVAP